MSRYFTYDRAKRRLTPSKNILYGSSSAFKIGKKAHQLPLQLKNLKSYMMTKSAISLFRLKIVVFNAVFSLELEV